MINLNIDKDSFISGFQMKSRKKSFIANRKPDPMTILSLSKGLRKDFCSSKNVDSSSKCNNFGKQSNFCEVDGLIMTPIKLTNLEIFLPNAPTSLKHRSPRKLCTATSKRKSMIFKSAISSSLENPVEMKTTSYLTHSNHLKSPIAARKQYKSAKNSLLSHSLKKNKTVTSNNEQFCRKSFAIENDKNNDSECWSPILYSPIYNNADT